MSKEIVTLKKVMARLERKMEKAKGPIEQARIVKSYLAKEKKLNRLLGISPEEDKIVLGDKDSGTSL